ncbi:MAG: hypothetical protein KIT87_01315 [Anaerolineae bacterium]|nr:hypothetical protein [Anaerolineae bacterium]
MSQLHSLRRRSWPTVLLGLMALLLAVLVPPQAALAHPLDVYLQATYITVAPAEIVVELDLSPGVLVAPQVLTQLDTDGDQQISDAESQAYADAVVRKVALRVDGQPLALAVTKLDMPTYLTIQAGYGTLRIFTTATLTTGMTGPHQLTYQNNNAPTGAAYQVNAFVDKGVAITLGQQNRDEVQQSLTMDYTIVSVATTETASGDTPLAASPSASDQARQLLAYLYQPTLSPWLLLVALGLSALLGGLHAMTPGHGKTLVAAYLIGSRGTTRHAVALGAIVTLTHTGSVVAVGLLALLASQYIVPGILVPALEIGSGALVVVMGVRLVRERWQALRGGDHHEHGSHDHPHPHPHDHDGSHAHHHHHLAPESIKPRDLLTLGISGGRTPGPEALGILLVAVGLNRIGLGLGLIVAFSLGLAGVLIGIGLLLVRSQSLVNRLGRFGGQWQRWLPLASALIVTLLGVGLALKGMTGLTG